MAGAGLFAKRRGSEFTSIAGGRGLGYLTLGWTEISERQPNQNPTPTLLANQMAHI